MSDTFDPKAVLASLTNYVDLNGHDRMNLNRMMYWKLNKKWPPIFGPKPGERGCMVPDQTQRLFDKVPVHGAD